MTLTATPDTAPTPLLELRGITKSYPGVKALIGVDFDVRAAEVHGLAGENGAGKSTLLKIMAGVIQPDAGELRWQGAPLRLTGPGDALKAGIRLIHQELNLVPYLSVAENICLGREPSRFGFLRRTAMWDEAKTVLDSLGFAIDPRVAVATLSVGQQQIVEIAKALAANAKIIAMDEPTSALTPNETSRLFELVDQLRARGVGLIYISHRMEELERLCDRVTILRDGQHVATRPMKSTPIPEVIRLMVGRTLDEAFPPRTGTPGEVVLRATNLRRRGVLHDVSFEVRKGEVFGIAGLMGSGRTELLRAIFGADPLDGGTVELGGQAIRSRSPFEAIRNGIALVPEDRKHHGLLVQRTIRENISMARLDLVSRAGVLLPRVERQVAEDWVKKLGVKTPTIEQTAKALSGGNQQKVVLAKWLLSDPKVLLLDEPTRGIDVGAKAEIYALMNRLTDEGRAVVMVSSELPEVLAMSDRIGVMHEGRMVATVPRAGATPELLMHCATGHDVADFGGIRTAS